MGFVQVKQWFLTRLYIRNSWEVFKNKGQPSIIPRDSNLIELGWGRNICICCCFSYQLFCPKFNKLLILELFQIHRKVAKIVQRIPAYPHSIFPVVNILHYHITIYYSRESNMGTSNLSPPLHQDSTTFSTNVEFYSKMTSRIPYYIYSLCCHSVLWSVTLSWTFLIFHDPDNSEEYCLGAQYSASDVFLKCGLELWVWEKTIAELKQPFHHIVSRVHVINMTYH